MLQDACHIWKYYIIKCYNMHVIFTYNNGHKVIFTVVKAGQIVVMDVTMPFQ